MRWGGIPEPMIDWYVFIKTNLECQFGPLTSMRFTGEPGTYCFNSDFNLAVTYIRHDIPDHVAVFISGDDSLIDDRLPVHPRWEFAKKLLKNLRFKLEWGPYGLFCGYYTSHAGAVRSPITLLTKLAIAEADGSMGNKIASYLAEFRVGHSLGDHQWESLPPDQVMYQSALFDFFCRRAPRDLKLSLNLDTPDDAILDKLASAGHEVSRSVFSLFNASQRFLYNKIARKPQQLLA